MAVIADKIFLIDGIKRTAATANMPNNKLMLPCGRYAPIITSEAIPAAKVVSVML